MRDHLWVRFFGKIRKRIIGPRSAWITVHQRNRRIHSGKGFFRSFDTPWSKRSWTNDLHLSINWRKSVKNMSWTWLPPIHDSRESCSGEALFGYLMKNRPHDIVIQWNSDWLIIIFSSYALATQLLYNQCLTRVDSAEFGAYHSTLQLEMFSAPLPLVSLLWFDLMSPNLVLAKVRLIF